MNHAEAQRRDNPEHVIVTKVDLIKARTNVQSVVHWLLAEKPGTRQVLNEAVSCLHRRGASLQARRLAEMTEALAQGAVARDPTLRDLLVEAADGLDGMGRRRLAKQLREMV